MRIPLFWKLFLSHLAMVALTAFFVGSFASGGIDKEARESTLGFLRAKIPSLEELARAELASTTIPSPLQDVVRRIEDRQGTRFTIIDAGGRVLADSQNPPADMENHGSRAEVLQARRDGFGEASRHSNTLLKDMLYVAKRVDAADGTLLGFVRVALPVVHLEARRADLNRSVLTAALLALGLGLLLCLVLARRFSLPLRELQRAAVSVAAGNYDERVPTGRRDQIGDLARAFETMAIQLRERIETITKERTELVTILGGMVEGVVAVDAGGRIVLMNDAAGRILDVDPAQAQGGEIWQTLPIRPVAEILASTLGGTTIGEAEVRLPGPPAERVLALHAAPIRGDTAEDGGVVLVMHDISELRGLERVRRDFVVNASHELKTPVAAIRGLVQTILDDAEMDVATQRSFLERADRQADRLAQIVQEMLALSRLEARSGGVDMQVLDVRETVDWAIDAAAPIAKERGVALEFDRPSEPTAIEGTQEGLRRIVGNLLDNAVKFTSENTRVAIRLAAEATRIVLEIRDQGPGIDARERERIFERFYRVDAGRSRDAGGTGLGLAIVKHLVLGLGGTISVAGGPGEGSTFRIELPRAPGPDETKGPR